MIRAWPESFPRVIRELNLDVPALLEASAGTGKTYAIEHLVLRILVEKPWPLESLLLLSFTEKTAGELREKIRRRLKEESGREIWGPAIRSRFLDAYLRCDDAAIHTMHGFCRSALSRHALDNGTLFNGEVLAERLLLETALEGLLRGPWARDEAHLRERLAAFEEVYPQGGWREGLLTLALAYQPERKDTLAPMPDPKRQSAVEIQLRAAVEKTESIFAALLRARPGGYSFSDYTQGFGSSKSGLERLAKDVFVGAFTALKKSKDPDSKIQSLSEFLKTISKNSNAVKKGFAAGLSAKAAADPEWLKLAEACESARNLALEAARIHAEERRRESYRWIRQAVLELRERLAWEKQRQGALSYDDMVLQLLQALRQRPRFAAGLREGYRACIVDEFQDTDSLQWELLQILCMQGSALPLFLVGDPKQAIYGFRGGDLGTYLLARTWLRDRARCGEAQGFSLSENYRSQPRLIAALNDIFARPDWFGSASGIPGSGSWHLPEESNSIAFTPALIPDAAQNVLEYAAPVVLRDFTACATKSAAEAAMHLWIASRIQNLVAGKDGCIVVEKDEPPRAPIFSDLAVLVRTNAEAAAMERHLRRRGIPCRVRRRGGVFDGVPADQIRLLLEFLEDAGDPRMQARLLLLPFLRGSAAWPEGLPEECPAPLQRWAMLAEAGRWPELFHAVLYESGYLYRLAADLGNGSEIRVFQSLARSLAEEGLRHGLSLRGLLQRFDVLRQGEGEEMGEVSDGNSDSRVTLMTLHLSKGLEFPVVFLAAVGQGRAPDFYTLRGPDGFRHMLDRNDAAAVHDWEQQTLDEEKRLFYVGLTRAKCLLHLPLFPERFTRGGSGPLGSFAAQSLRAAARDKPDLFRFESGEIPRHPFEAAQALPVSLPAPALADRDPWEEAGAYFLPRQRRLSSYSQLVKREALTALEEDGKRLNREAGESEDPEMLPVEIVTAADLPPGAETGNALHELLESLDFASAARAASAEAWLQETRFAVGAAPILRRHGLEEKHLPVLARLAWNTLRMPLPDPFGGAGFTLASTGDRKHEVEFLLPISGIAPDNLPAGISRRNGFLWGFMDLVFRQDGRYYLLDWKSNLLDRYDRASIEQDMAKHHYALQYQLYSVALDKWLESQLNGYDPDLHFGGVFYVYLRGASAHGPFSGFSCRPDTRELRETFPASLRSALGLRLETESVRS